jgi:hypothetical protein
MNCAKNLDDLSRRTRISRAMARNAIPNHAIAGRANWLARTIPAMNEIEIHTNGMDGIVH